MEISLVYDQSVSVDQWQTQHAQDLVPSKWPYGLDLLNREGLSISPISGPPRNLASDLWDSLARGLSSPGTGHRKPLTTGGVAIAWDEVGAIALLRSNIRGSNGCGVIWMQDSAASLKEILRKWVSRRTFRSMDFVWCLSDAQAKALHAEHGQRKAIEVLPFGIDTEFFAQSDYPESRLVFSAGNDRHRDIATLYEAFQLVHDVLPDVEFAVQSDSGAIAPTFVKRLPRMAHSQLRECYQKSSLTAVACKPNMHVSGMTVALETMSVGRPIVITDTLGMSEYVHHSKTGYLVRPYDPADLAGRIISTLNDPHKASQMGSAGRANVVARHTTRAMADALADIIRRYAVPYQ